VTFVEQVEIHKGGEKVNDEGLGLKDFCYRL